MHEHMAAWRSALSTARTETRTELYGCLFDEEAFGALFCSTLVESAHAGHQRGRPRWNTSARAVCKARSRITKDRQWRAFSLTCQETQGSGRQQDQIWPRCHLIVKGRGIVFVDPTPSYEALLTTSSEAAEQPRFSPLQSCSSAGAAQQHS